VKSFKTPHRGIQAIQRDPRLARPPRRSVALTAELYMKSALNWPIEIIHEKCQSSLASLQIDIGRITVNRRGILRFELHCFQCQEEFALNKNMLELTALAALGDKEYLGDDLSQDPGIATIGPN
jgi:hypothetical protein